MRTLARPKLQTLVIALSVLTTCSAAFAEDKPGDKGGAIAALLLLGITPVFQLILASLAPTFTRQLQRAVAQCYWPATGWGALVLMLSAIVAGVLTKGGKPGQAAGMAVTVAVVALSLAGGVGIAKAIGDWVFRRWGMQSLGPVSVLVGAPIWSVGVAVPVVGWIAGLLTLLASLGAASLVILQPRRFADPSPLPPAVPPMPPVLLAKEQTPAPPLDSSGIE